MRALREINITCASWANFSDPQVLHGEKLKRRMLLLAGKPTGRRDQLPGVWVRPTQVEARHPKTKKLLSRKELGKPSWYAVQAPGVAGNNRHERRKLAAVAALELRAKRTLLTSALRGMSKVVIA